MTTHVKEPALRRTEPIAAPSGAGIPRYSWSQRARSRYHAIWYRLGAKLAWSRGLYRERPAGRLSHLTDAQQARITSLQSRYSVRFEQDADRTMALKCYDYLDILDQAWSMWARPRPTGGAVHDVGSSNFWYAPVLQAFFQPAELTGVEVEGHRLYRNGYSRWDYARGYIQNVSNAHFVIDDYATFDRPADLVTAWYPFVTPAPLLAWRLPLSLFAPAAVFRRIAANVRPDGVFVMVNQGRDEAAIAAAMCGRAGLELINSVELCATLRERPVPPVVSCWAVVHSS